MAGEYTPNAGPAAYPIGDTVYWTDNGVAKSGVVLSTPTLHPNGYPKQNGGEPFYRVSYTEGNQTYVYVRASEITSG